jgi:cyclase
MVKTRLIPVLYVMNGLIVRSEGFSIHQNIGNIINQAQRYNEWDVDELIYIDITRSGNYNLRRDDHRVESYSGIQEIISRIASVCFMPLTFGGGIKNIEDAGIRIRLGADKVTINTAAIENPKLISQISACYGSQAVVVSIDYKIIDGKPIVHSRFGHDNTGIDLEDWVKRCIDFGAGEILLTSIDNDGLACGYDLDTIRTVVNVSKVPVIACGGAGEFYDFVEVVRETGVSAVAAGNIFHFTERSYPRAKQLMKNKGINVRF